MLTKKMKDFIADKTGKPAGKSAMKVLICLLGFALLLGCSDDGTSPANQIQSQTYFIFDTIVTVRIYDEKAGDQHFAAIEDILEDIDAKMNRNLASSEIAKVNAMSGKEPVQVSPETLEVVKTAAAFAELSSGRFDPTIGPLVDLWGIGGDSPKIPSEAELQEAMALVDYREVEIDEEAGTIYLKQQGMSLDLGGIAKGYAADRISAYLSEAGFESAIIDLGGNILAKGIKPNGSLWTIGVQDPDETRGTTVATIPVEDKTVVSSGVYERYFIQDGVRYHHIFDTQTGYPVDNELLSVTIVTDRSMDADALSTAVFALGLEQGLEFVAMLDEVEAIFVTEDKKVYPSEGLKGKLEMTSEEYTLIE